MLPLAVIALLAIGMTGAAACGDDDDDGATQQPTAEDQDSVAGPGAGAIVPNTFLTHEGAQYRLSDILQADLEDESQFSEVGEATEADVDGDLTVFTKDGDAESVYTFWQGSGSGDTATPDSWYRWEPAD
ncbi:MAG: hypothetical protein WD904_10900 [Dehalococcoidia bacterium]